MTEDSKGPERVTFSRGYDVCIMAHRRDLAPGLPAQRHLGYRRHLTVEGSIQGLNLKEFFLLLSSTGLAYRRCELVRVNGTEMDVHFLKGKHAKKRPGASSKDAIDEPVSQMRCRADRRLMVRDQSGSGWTVERSVSRSQSSLERDAWAFAGFQRRSESLLRRVVTSDPEQAASCRSVSRCLM